MHVRVGLLVRDMEKTYMVGGNCPTDHAKKIQLVTGDPVGHG